MAQIILFHENKVKRESLKVILQDKHNVATAITEDECLSMISSVSPEIAVVGFNRYGAENLGFLKQLKSSSPDMGILLFIHGEIREDISDLYLGLSDETLTEPFSIDDIETAVRKIISRERHVETKASEKMDVREFLFSPEIMNATNALIQSLFKMEDIPLAIMVIDKEFKIQSINDEGAQLFGFPQKNLIGMDVRLIDSALEEIFKKADSSEIPATSTMTIFNRKKLPLPIEIAAVNLRNDSGTVWGYSAAFIPSGHIPESSKSLRASDRLRQYRHLASKLAQVIKNPLVSITTFSQLLPEKYGDPEFRTTFSEVVQEEVQRLNTFIEEIIHYTNPEPLDLALTDINTIIHSVLKTQQEQLKGKNIQIIKDLDDSLPLITADEKKIRQVIHHLITNSIDSFVNEGYIAVETKTGADDRKYVTINISDSGCGIRKSEIKKIARPFYTTKTGSLGLGLNITKQIIDAHKGTVRVRSIEGRGTYISVYLPVAPGREGDVKGSKSPDSR